VAGVRDHRAPSGLKPAETAGRRACLCRCTCRLLTQYCQRREASPEKPRSGATFRFGRSARVIERVGSAGEPALHPVQDAHEETGRSHGFGGFCDVVVVDLSVPGRVTQHGVRALEEIHHADLLARDRVRVSERPVRAKCVRHKGDAEDVVSELR
jgi:hypothetical protein